MIDRREFLSAAAAGAVLTLTGARRLERTAPSDPRDVTHPALLGALSAETVREIGAAYRALVPAERDRASLEAALRDERRSVSEHGEDPVRADFAAGRVIVVRCWVLSHTEARQCALYSLRLA